MALLRGKLLAGALFAGALFAFDAAPSIEAAPPSYGGGGVSAPRQYNNFHKNRVEVDARKSRLLAQQRAEDDALLEIIITFVTGIDTT